MWPTVTGALLPAAWQDTQGLNRAAALDCLACLDEHVRILDYSKTLGS